MTSSYHIRNVPVRSRQSPHSRISQISHVGSFRVAHIRSSWGCSHEERSGSSQEELCTPHPKPAVDKHGAFSVVENIGRKNNPLYSTVECVVFQRPPRAAFSEQLPLHYTMSTSYTGSTHGTHIYLVNTLRTFLGLRYGDLKSEKRRF